jgi:predicted RNA binding protein YcfA (HicA-like mRNA interferase family)
MYATMQVKSYKDGSMPPKIRKLKAKLEKAGFVCRSAKGSHTRWKHPLVPEIYLTLSGKDGEDANEYKIRQVDEAIAKVQEKERARTTLPNNYPLE